MLVKCSATTKDGRPCSAQAWQGGLCRWHHPQLQEDRHEWRKRGGERRSNQARAKKHLPDDLMTLRQVQGALCRAMRALEAGEMTPAVANALGGRGRSIAAVAEAGDLEERLSQLEQRAGLTEGKTA